MKDRFICFIPADQYALKAVKEKMRDFDIVSLRATNEIMSVCEFSGVNYPCLLIRHKLKDNLISLGDHLQD